MWRIQNDLFISYTHTHRYTLLKWHLQSLKGFLATVTNSLSRLVAILICYGLGAISNLHYYNIALVAAGVVVVFEVLMLCTYESPRWLFKRGP